MFTGIVSHTGRVLAARRNGTMELVVDCPAVARALRRGDSIGVDGVCLTATRASRRRFATRVVEETLARTTLADVGRGDEVNLELPARPVDRLGGHLVQGHVDGVAEAVRVEEDGDCRRVWWRADEDMLRYVVPKGSVALDGVSLTVVDAGRTSFEVALIPHTLRSTTLGRARPGARANLEVDVIAKYVARLVGSGREG
jgi:riboflavin synthase